MDFHQSVKNSIENIQDELTRISTLASLFDYKPSEADISFQKKVLQEYNSKLHKMRSENARLHEKNKALTERVRYLESRARYLGDNDSEPIKARAFKSDGALKPVSDRNFLGPPTKKRTLSPQKAKLEILSSPIKQEGGDVEKKSPTKRFISQSAKDDNIEITSSQFNRLATQYSDVSSQPEGNYRPPEFEKDTRNLVKEDLFASRSSSPVKNLAKRPSIGARPVIPGSFASDDESDGNNPSPVVADSQDEFEPLGKTGWYNNDENRQKSSTITKVTYPSHYTALQRIEFFRNYFRQKVSDKSFKLDFSRNPITEKKWTLEDFVVNEKWKPPKKLNTNLGVMTKAQEKTYSDFFDKAGLGRKSVGPAWDSDEEIDQAIDAPNWVRSQVMDKYSSPPGYMVGDFVSTQEEAERKRLILEKEDERIKRRFASAISGGEFLFYEKVFNDFVKTGRYVNGPGVKV